MARKLADVLISIREDYLDRMPEVARGLRAAGMRVDRSLSLLGTIAGAADLDIVRRLGNVEGVAAVESPRLVAKA